MPITIPQCFHCRVSVKWTLPNVRLMLKQWRGMQLGYFTIHWALRDKATELTGAHSYATHSLDTWWLPN